MAYLPPPDVAGSCRGGRHGRVHQVQDRCTLHAGAEFFTDKQQALLQEVFANDQRAEVEATWGTYQRMVTAYREPDRGLGKFVIQQLIDSLTRGVPGPLVALRKRPYLEAAHSRYPRLL